MNLRLLLSYFVVVIVLFGATFILKVNANTSSSITIDLTPPNPNPNESTTITLHSYSDNLDVVQITWSVNGKNVASGIGKKSVSVQAGSSGSTILVIATIKLPDGPVQESVVIRPAEMVMLWQADDSYVPPFYEGKALPSAGSDIKVVAMPEVRINGTLNDFKNMTYNWSEDYNNAQGNSGYGKNVFTFINDYLESSNNIEVSASTLDQKYSSAGNIDIGASAPKIVFYKNDPTLGTLWENALVDFHKINDSEVIQGIPYFISPKKIQNPALVWSWFINDTQVNVSSSAPNYLRLKAEGTASGTSKIKLQVDNKYRIFESVDKEMNVQF